MVSTPEKVQNRLKMTQAQFDNVLANLSLEVEDRLQKLNQKSQLLMASLRLRLDLELGRFPTEVRQMSVKQFCEQYRGDLSYYSEVSYTAKKKHRTKTPGRSGRGGAPKSAQKSRFHPYSSSKSLHHQAVSNATKQSGVAETPGAQRRTRVISTRSSSVIAVPMSVRKNGNKESTEEDFILDLDNSASPDTTVLADLDSPARREVELQITQLQNKLQKVLNRIKK